MMAELAEVRRLVAESIAAANGLRSALLSSVGAHLPEMPTREMAVLEEAERSLRAKLDELRGEEPDLASSMAALRERLAERAWRLEASREVGIAGLQKAIQAREQERAVLRVAAEPAKELIVLEALSKEAESLFNSDQQRARERDDALRACVSHRQCIATATGEMLRLRQILEALPDANEVEEMRRKCLVLAREAAEREQTLRERLDGVEPR
jgi:hypothetical protein